MAQVAPPAPATSALIGSRIRERRGILGIKQADLAKTVGISASYLNLIEHNRRRIGGKLLLALAEALDVEPTALSEGAEASLLRAMQSAAEDAATAPELDRMQEFAGRFPGWAGLVADQYSRIERLEQTLQELSDRLTHDTFLSASVHEMLSTVTAIRSTVAILADEPDIEPQWRSRFHANLREESVRLTEATEALVAYLDAPPEGVALGASPQDELDQWLDRRGHYLREVEQGGAPDFPTFTPPAQELAEAHVARYGREARVLPEDALATALEDHGVDPLAIARAVGEPLDLVLRRLGQVPATGRGVGLVECDTSGTLITRRAPEGFPFPRHGVGRSLWPLFSALARPHVPIRAEIAIVEGQGARLTAFAYAATEDAATYGAEPSVRATMLLIPV